MTGIQEVRVQVVGRFVEVRQEYINVREPWGGREEEAEGG